MENQNENEWMSADIVKKEYEEDQKQNDEARAQSAKYVKLKDKEQITIKLTGRTRFYSKTFESSPEAKKMYDFELEEKNSKGENKIFSISSVNPACGDLLKAISQKKLTVTIKRIGTQKATTYMVIAV